MISMISVPHFSLSQQVKAPAAVAKCACNKKGLLQSQSFYVLMIMIRCISQLYGFSRKIADSVKFPLMDQIALNHPTSAAA